MAQLCKALADSLRLEILRLLRTESFGVLEICRAVEIRQSALSHHLKVLANAGLVSTRREGNSIFYRRALISSSDALPEFKQSAFASTRRRTYNHCILGVQESTQLWDYLRNRKIDMKRVECQRRFFLM